MLDHITLKFPSIKMEGKELNKRLQPMITSFQTLDLADREMNLSYTTITTKTKGVALVMSNDYVGNGGNGDSGETPEIKIHEESKKLSECLNRFDYFVHHRRNIAKQEFIKLCHRLAEYKYPSNCKRIVVAFSGRGFDGVLQLRDGERIFLEDVVRLFKSNNAALPGGMIRIFFIDTHHESSIGSLVQGDSVIVKAGDDCRCLSRINTKINTTANLLVAYSFIRYHDQDAENFNLHGKWTGCLAAELDRSQSVTSMQNVLATVNKAMTDIATAAKFFQSADYCSSAEDLFISPSFDGTVSTTEAISLPITQSDDDDKLNLESFRADILLLSRPELKQLIAHVTPSYAAQWKTLGILLDLPLGILQSIEYDYPKNCIECCNRMLTEWHERDTKATWQKIFDILDSSVMKNPETFWTNSYNDGFSIYNILLMMMMNTVPLIQTKWPLIGKELKIPDIALNKISEECDIPSKDTCCCIKMLTELLNENENINISEFLRAINVPHMGLKNVSSLIEQHLKDFGCSAGASQSMISRPSFHEDDARYALMISKVINHLEDSKIELSLLVNMLKHYRSKISKEKIPPVVYESATTVSDLISSLQDHGYINHTDLDWLKFLAHSSCEAIKEIEEYKNCLIADKIKWSNIPNRKHRNGYLVAVTNTQPKDVTLKDMNETKSIAANVMGLKPTDAVIETGAVGSVHFHWRILFCPHSNIELPTVITAEIKQVCINAGVLQIGILLEQKSKFVTIEDLIVTKVTPTGSSSHSISELSTEDDKQRNKSDYNIADEPISSSTTLIECLDLSYHKLNTVEAINIALLNTISIKCLKMNNNEICDEAAGCLAAIICKNLSLTELNISYNKLTLSGITGIINALSKSNTIEVLDISYNCIAPNNTDDLAVALSACTRLKILNISHNSLTFTCILKIAQKLRDHGNLQTLNISNNIKSFVSEAEVLVDIILSANNSLTHLDISGRNIRPRFAGDYLSPPLGCEENSCRFLLHNLYLSEFVSLTDLIFENTSVVTPPNFIQAIEECPIPNSDIISYYVNHNGGTFYNQDHDFAIVVPPGAVLQSDGTVEIQATASYKYFKQYQFPDGYLPVSSVFWFSADYTFKIPVCLIMSHYASSRSKNLHFMQACIRDLTISDDGKFVMKEVTDGVYIDDKIGYCLFITDHYCSVCLRKNNTKLPGRFSALFYTYVDGDVFNADLCFIPSNSDCRREIEKQYKGKKFDIPISFEFCKGESLHIPTDFSKIEGWYVRLAGKTEISYDEFEYWRYEELDVSEQYQEYPPRFRIRCVRKSAHLNLLCDFIVQKKRKNEILSIVGQFPFAKMAEGSEVQRNGTIQQHTVHTSEFCGNIEDRAFLKISKMINEDWERIGLMLEVKRSILNCIDSNYTRVEDKALRMLFKWKDGNSQACRCHLLSALTEQDIPEAVEYLKRLTHKIC